MRTTPVVDPRPVDRPMCSLPTCDQVMPSGGDVGWLMVSIGTNQVMSTVGGLSECYCSWSHLVEWARQPLADKVGIIKANGAPTADLAAWAKVADEPPVKADPAAGR